MRSRFHFHSLVFTAVCTSAVALFLSDFSEARALALEDVLRMEDVGAVGIDPTGRRVVFERIPSLLERRDFALSQGRYEGQLYVYDLQHRSTPTRLFPNSTFDGEWLGPFAPSGTKVAIYWREGQKVRAGVYDFVRGHLVPFSFTPSIDFARSEPVWLSDDELLYAALPDGEQPARVAFIRKAAERLADSWQHAWSGDRTTASVIRSPGGIEHIPLGTLTKANARNGSSQAIAEGNFVALTLSPNRRYLAAALRENLVHFERGTDVTGMQGYRYVPMLIDLSRPRSEIAALCDQCDAMHATFQWGPSSDALVFFARHIDQGWEDATFRFYTAADNRVQEIPHVGLDLASQRERGYAAVPEIAVPYRGGIAVVAREQSNRSAPPTFSDKAFDTSQKGRIDWYALKANGDIRKLTTSVENVSPVLAGMTGSDLLVFANGGLYRLGDTARLIHSEHATLSLAELEFDRSARSRDLTSGVVVAYSTSHNGMAVTFDHNGKVLGQVRRPTGDWSLAAVTSDGRSAVFRRVGTPGALAVRHMSGRPRLIWSFNRHFDNVQFASEVYVSYKTELGDEMRSCALLPPGGQVRKAPILVYVYPGSFKACERNYARGVADPYEPELFASLGYTVLFPSAPDTKLRTATGPLGNWSALVEPAVQALDRDGYGDADRAGLFGLSYGSISVLALLTQSDKFKAAVASHGAANFGSHYGTLGIVRRLLPESLFAVGQSVAYESKGSFLWLGAVPWEDPARFDAASPFFQIDKIRTPLMLMHSDLDWNYQMDQFDQVFTALYRLGREVEYVRYWGEGHGITSPANIRDMWARLEKWYASHLATLSGDSSPQPSFAPLP